MPVASWDIEWVGVETFTSQYNTDVDGEYTVHEQRNALWTNDRCSFAILVPNKQANHIAILAFWRARKGRWNAFNFTWDAAKGGDGVTYLVRFDTDKLTLDAKGGHFRIPVATVVTSE